jgi:hypothetical protein
MFESAGKVVGYDYVFAMNVVFVVWVHSGFIRVKAFEASSAFDRRGNVVFVRYCAITFNKRRFRRRRYAIRFY